MSDPTPALGLPGNEWIELKNISSTPINLQYWRVGDAAGFSGGMPLYILAPDSFVLVCSNGALALMSAFGPAIAVTNFPSLDNDGDLLILQSSTGITIHAINYSVSWYQNELKKDGGWTLEMIDPHNPCSGNSNWKASNDPAGGSPGKKNSVNDSNSDIVAPRLKRTYTVDDSTIIAVFDEPVDSVGASSVLNYSISSALNIVGAVAMAPLFNKVRLRLASPLQSEKIYELSAININDCMANTLLQGQKARAGKPDELLSGDVIINELLFNPRTTGEDYVELYNRSNKIVDVSAMHIANRNSSGVISSVRSLSATAYLLFPGDYVVATADEVGLAREYLVGNPDGVFSISSPPSMPDDNGFAILLNQQGEIIDEVNYDHNWHFKLLDNEEGVAIERIDPHGPTQDPANWHSAASTAGYGTPTTRNSQYKKAEPTVATIQIHPKIFSPDNDGRDDMAMIQYKLAEPGYVANLTVFDPAGRPVRYLIRNAIMGLEGHWTWNGLGDDGQKLRPGPYVLLTELFNLNGKKQKYKQVVILARNL